MRDLIHVEEAHLGDYEEHAVLRAVLHEHWEIAVLLDLDIGRPLDLLLAWRRVPNLHDVELLNRFARLLLAETEQGVLVAVRVRHRHVGESGGEALQNLLLPLFGEEKLHVAADLVVGALIDSNEVAPLFGGVDSVAHDLSIGEFRLLVKHLCRR